MPSRRVLFLCLGLGLVVAVLALVWGGPVAFFDLWSENATRRDAATQIILGLRPLRIVTGILVGASLSVAGAGLQTMFRNPLADPFLLGISAGGAVGATVATALRLDSIFGVEAALPLAWLGAMAAAFAVYALGKPSGTFDFAWAPGGSRARLLLVGVALSAFLSALLSLLVTLSGRYDLVQTTTFWLLGGLSRSDWRQNAVLAATFLVGIAILLSCARDLNALRAGDEEAAALGVELSKLHRKILVASSLLAASSVAVAGLIGFVGLLAPHLVRLLGGREAKTLLGGAALLGATLLVGCDALAARLFTPIEVPVGIFTALLGVPLFLALARRS